MTPSDEVRVAGQVEGPPTIAVDSTAEGFPARSVAIQMTVFKLKARSVGSLCDEVDLNLAGVALVCLELPLGADVPAEDDPFWRLVSEDTSPSAFTSVSGFVVNVPTDRRLESRLADLGSEEVVFGWLEVAEAFDERGKGGFDGYVHDDLSADCGIIGHGQLTFSCGCPLTVVRPCPGSR